MMETAAKQAHLKTMPKMMSDSQSFPPMPCALNECSGKCQCTLITFFSSDRLFSVLKDVFLKRVLVGSSLVLSCQKSVQYVSPGVVHVGRCT